VSNETAPGADRTAKTSAKKSGSKSKQMALAVGLVGVLFVLLVVFYLTRVGVVEFTYQGY